MNLSRRQALFATLFGTGAVGLRALATGLPAAFFLNPRKALADNTCPKADPSKAQYFIMSTSGAGDPVNANCPGAYILPELVHPLDASMAPTSLTLSGQAYTAAKPWASTAAGGLMDQAWLDRAMFFHLSTNTVIHPQEVNVLQLMGASPQHEMLPSLLAKAVWPSLCTVQPQPVAVGSNGPGEALQFSGSTLPIIPPGALQDTLLGPKGPLTSLQSVRDQAMKDVYKIYRDQATPPQQAFLDSWINTQDQVRKLSTGVLDILNNLSKDPIEAQIQASVALILLNVTPVVSIHIPFGGDNHSDANLAREVDETTGGKATTGVKAIAFLLNQLKNNGVTDLSDKVTFFNHNVFGRTYTTNGGTDASNGRGHHGPGTVNVCIGKPFKGGVIGGVGKVQTHLNSEPYGAAPIDSKSGALSASGDIASNDTMASFAMTLLHAVGGDSTLITSPTGKVVSGALVAP